MRKNKKREQAYASDLSDMQWEEFPWRWVVERTFSWLNNSRRLSKDYEITVDSAEAVIKISHLHTLLKRL